MDRKRNISFDYLKLILSFFVVLIHMQPLPFSETTITMFDWLISNGIARVAVPCFFILGGYYLLADRNMMSYVKHLLIVYIVWCLIYLPYLDINRYFVFHLFWGYLHLWYIIALVEGLLVLYVLKKIKVKDKYLFIMSLALFFAGFFLERYFIKEDSLYGSNLLYVRNYLTIGIPFLFIGSIIKKYEKRLQEIKASYLYAILAFFIIALFVESALSYSPDVWPPNFYISLLFVCPVLIICVLKKSVYSDIPDSSISKLSSGIYFIHLFIISVVMLLPIEVDYLMKVFLVFLISMLFSFCIMQINKILKIFL